MLGRKQRHQVVRSFPNRYLFSLTNKVTCLFPISCILEIILACKSNAFVMKIGCFWGAIKMEWDSFKSEIVLKEGRSG